MAKEVIKKDGSRQPFDPEKIKGAIRVAAKEAGLGEERIKEIVEKVAATAIELAQVRAEIQTSELREHILKELDELEPSVSEVWRKYDEKNKPQE